jgi:hypothetical protein
VKQALPSQQPAGAGDGEAGAMRSRETKGLPPGPEVSTSHPAEGIPGLFLSVSRSEVFLVGLLELPSREVERNLFL